MAIINLSDLRFGRDKTVSERYNSVFAVSSLIFLFIFPFFMVLLYKKKIRRTRPLPELSNDMTVERIKKIYGTLDIAEIKKNAYTKSKH